MSLWLVLMSMLAHPGSCEMINRDQIRGEDLARALPAFAKMPADAPIGYSPAIGARRVLAFPELERMGQKYGISVPAESKACFEWKLRALTEADVRAAVRDALASPDARIEVIAMSPAMIPEGKLVFPLSGLSAVSVQDPATPVTWRGQVLYGGSRKFGVLARVRASAMVTRVVSTEMLLAGEAVAERQIRLETLEDFPLQHGIARNLEEVTGMVPRLAIRAGKPVFLADLATPLLVKKGEAVKVTVISGAAQLTLEATANESGRQGEEISVTNPRTGKVFRGRVDGKSAVKVIPGAVTMLTRVQ
jgi:flagella basal body P-ring formation protein FlgA